MAPISHDAALVPRGPPETGGSVEVERPQALAGGVQQEVGIGRDPGVETPGGDPQPVAPPPGPALLDGVRPASPGPDAVRNGVIRARRTSPWNGWASQASKRRPSARASSSPFRSSEPTTSGELSRSRRVDPERLAHRRAARGRRSPSPEQRAHPLVHQLDQAGGDRQRTGEHPTAPVASQRSRLARGQHQLPNGQRVAAGGAPHAAGGGLIDLAAHDRRVSSSTSASASTPTSIRSA